MLALLRETEIADWFKKQKAAEKRVDVAVAFWGKGAAAKLGLNRLRGRTARVICNLSTPACNPYEIDKLMGCRGVKVKTHPRLHAKVYAGAGFCIIGSSNVSTNGMIDGEGKGSIEANVGSDDPQLVGEASGLFKALWKSRESRDISKAMLKQAQVEYDRFALATKNPAAPKTLLAAARQDPDRFGNIYVALASGQISPAARRVLDNLRRGAVSVRAPAGLNEGLSARSFKNAIGYQFEDPVPANSWIIDPYCGGKPENAVRRFQATGLLLKVPGGEIPLQIALSGGARASETPIPRMSAREKRKLHRLGRTYPGKWDGVFVPLAEALAFIDRRKRRG